MINFNPTYEFLSKIFLELVSDSNFKTAFQAIAPEIYADIESASTNPNCSCRNKIEHVINNNRQKFFDFLLNLPYELQTKINIDAINSKYTHMMYAGSVKRVKISEWDSFYRKLVDERAAYRSFSVLRNDEETVDVFFL
jgi:hypothetical protein